MKRFLHILQLTPMIIALVHTAEAAIPGDKKGPVKLNLILDTVNTAVSATPELQNEFSTKDLNSLVTTIVTTTVNSINTAKGK